MARGHGKKSGKGRKAAAPSWRDVWNVLGNPAGGDCGLHTMLQQLLMMKRGMSATEAVEATRLAAGTPEMCELLMLCRRRIVDYLCGSPDFVLFFEDGVPAFHHGGAQISFKSGKWPSSRTGATSTASQA